MYISSDYLRLVCSPFMEVPDGGPDNNGNEEMSIFRYGSIGHINSCMLYST